MMEKEVIKILFVEDIPEDLIIAEETLKRESLNFISENATNLEEFQIKLKEFSPDIIISDYNLPGFNAIDVLNVCKNINPDIPFIVFTASINEEVAVKCLKNGADDYILKNYIKKLPFAVMEAINRKRMKIEAERERQILHTIVSHSPVGIVLLDKEQRIIHANEAFAKIFDIKKDEAIGHYCDDFIDKIYDREGKEISLYDYPVRKAYRDKKTLRIDEYCIKRKDGREVVFTVSIVPIFYKSDNLSMVIAIFNDITEYKKVFNQLIQAQKLESMGRLVGGIAHDFNNMLNAVLGFADLSLKLIDKENKVYRYIENIYTAGNRAKGLIGQLLSFCRKSVQKLEILNINELIRETKDMIEKIIGEDIKIVYSLEENLLNILADKTQMTQVIINLLTNAREAMPEGGQIYITTKNIKLTEQYYDLHMGNFVLLSITDTGIGMSKEIMEHIFEPFFTTKEHGTGLGLATVYGIVKQNNGYIHVYSEVGQGTTFKIYLPSIEEESKDLTLSEETEIAGGNETILIVEDNDEVRTFLCNALEMKGYSLKDFANPLEALQFVKDNDLKIDLLVSDVVMPNMSGIALYEKLREIYKDLKVLFISGYPDLPQRERELINKENFISKPFTVNELFKKVRQILDQS
ncbi:MAG: response regulator [Proteobacteria bacterium]|nr:response regulator [Pseudomonadota bacterium]